ncbi:MAG: winged helix-turn-helix transcriptional regulator [Firmicutes bacterium]|nr:winged helix-turn-helix transcriptional regulator [Bacillota bacterium]
MPLNLKLDGNSDSPLYKQIVESIQRAVHSGKLPSGYQLPTVRELADEMGISRGTIKHAYDQLQRLGIVEMTQGKGTFILGQTEEDNASRKEKAMVAIDQLFEQLEDLGFTPREMEIYVGLKLRGLEEKYDVVKVAIMDCNPETLNLIQEQLSQIGYAEVASFGLSQLNEVVEKLNSDYDLILTTSTHFAQVEHFIHPAKTLGMMALMPTPRTIFHLAKILDESSVGIVAASDNFAGIIRRNCQDMGDWSKHMDTQLFGNRDKLRLFLMDKDVIILPEGYMVFASVQERELLASFERNGGQLITYDYKIDRGSYLYVEELIKRCMNKKRSL